MTQPVSRAEFDALCDAVQAVAALQDQARLTTQSLIEAQTPVGAGLKVLQQMGAAVEQLLKDFNAHSAVVSLVLRLAIPHLPPSALGAIDAALEQLATAAAEEGRAELAAVVSALGGPSR